MKRKAVSLTLDSRPSPPRKRNAIAECRRDVAFLPQWYLLATSPAIRARASHGLPDSLDDSTRCRTMKTKLASLSCVLALTAATLDAGIGQAPPVVPLNKLKDHLGRRVTACGRVVSYDADWKDRSIVFDLQKPYWSRDVGILLLQADRGRFIGDVVDPYLKAEVCATGVVERRNGRRLIRITEPADLDVRKRPPTGFASLMAGAVRPSDAGVEGPQVVTQLNPNYTPDAMGARLQGRTLVEAVVLPDGRVGPARLLVGFEDDFGLHEQSIRAIRQWRFKPGMRDGQPVPVTILIELSFTLK